MCIRDSSPSGGATAPPMPPRNCTCFEITAVLRAAQNSLSLWRAGGGQWDTETLGLLDTGTLKCLRV
eukprot:7906969-Alexandrium_andersonii.AAC.1